ncbi:hypothetical protein OJAV_G00211690 [Oryzias javanicus]|uniref:Uncharacterized protein n=1 Tax=Oryzias javanicus TaxID=123683 RepID=A0A3S2PP00_ORYJA|nr:hypothetical protein OJAV_G00211690 [Oryzias javanicus]
MKNKSVLCRPFTVDQESMCQLPEDSSQSGAVAPALLASSSQPNQPTTTPAQTASPKEEIQVSNGVPARLTGRHFLGKKETNSDCKVCSQRKRKKMEEEEEPKSKKPKTEDEPEGTEGGETSASGEQPEVKDCGSESQTLYYCKTCSGEPSLCPVPCFELYHTRLIYKMAPELETPDVEEKEKGKVKVVMVPVPVPVYIPVPVNMYSQHMPVPLVIPMLCIPVPVVVPPQTKDMTDAAVQSEVVTADNEKQEKEFASCAVQSDASSFEDLRSEAVDPTTRDLERTHKAVQVDLLLPTPSDKSSDAAESQPDNQSETSAAKSDSSAPDPKTEAPSSSLMDLETDFPLEPLEQKAPVLQRGVKRPREGSFSRKRGRRRTVLAESSASAAPATFSLNHVYGLKAWKNWVEQRKQQPQESSPLDLKEDILQYNSAELSCALSRFIKELRRPNGDTYSPDSIFYLCLGIQQYIFLKGRIENIFTDELYGQFASEISSMLQLWKPSLLPNGGVVPSRVEESFLWECKQLGAYSPIVLLNTLLFFCTKNFHLTTVEQHQHLSFSNFTRRSKICSRAGKVCYLNYRRSAASTDQTDLIKKQRPVKEEDLEMLENVTYPLHCPVRLYEFYLSRCPESVRDRPDVFYLQPETNVHTESCHWYSSDPLDAATLQSMLTRILAVREVQQELEAARLQSSTEGGGE